MRGQVRDTHHTGDGDDFADMRAIATDQHGDTISGNEIHLQLPRRLADQQQASLGTCPGGGTTNPAASSIQDRWRPSSSR